MVLQIYESAISCTLDNKLAVGAVINIAVNDLGQGAMQAKRPCSNPNRRLSKLWEPVAKQGLCRKQAEYRIARRQALFQVFQPGTVAAPIRGCAAH
jgi:hypothetical protein